MTHATDRRAWWVDGKIQNRETIDPSKGHVLAIADPFLPAIAPEGTMVHVYLVPGPVPELELSRSNPGETKC